METIKPIKTDCACGHPKHDHQEYTTYTLCWGDSGKMYAFKKDQFVNCLCNGYVMDNLKYMESVYDASH